MGRSEYGTSRLQNGVGARCAEDAPSTPTVWHPPCPVDRFPHPSDRVGVTGSQPRDGGRRMASTIFARIGDIKGESQDIKHKDEIDVLSWSWGVTQSGSMGHGGGGGEGKATFHDL